MGKHHRETTIKRRMDLFMDKNALAEQLAANRAIRAAMAAAAVTLNVLYQFTDARAREFLDDMDLTLENLINNPENCENILHRLDVTVRTNIGTDTDGRVTITHPDRNLCESCEKCKRDKHGLYCCPALGLKFRRGRSVCRSWAQSGRKMGPERS